MAVATTARPGGQSHLHPILLHHQCQVICPHQPTCRQPPVSIPSHLRPVLPHRPDAPYPVGPARGDGKVRLDWKLNVEQVCPFRHALGELIVAPTEDRVEWTRVLFEDGRGVEVVEHCGVCGGGGGAERRKRGVVGMRRDAVLVEGDDLDVSRGQMLDRNNSLRQQAGQRGIR